MPRIFDGDRPLGAPRHLQKEYALSRGAESIHRRHDGTARVQNGGEAGPNIAHTRLAAHLLDILQQGQQTLERAGETGYGKMGAALGRRIRPHPREGTHEGGKSFGQVTPLRNA